MDGFGASGSSISKNQSTLREIREAYNAAFQALFDACVFERKLGTLDVTIHNTSFARGVGRLRPLSKSLGSLCRIVW